jgi:hypothetical protein
VLLTGIQALVDADFEPCLERPAIRGAFFAYEDALAELIGPAAAYQTVSADCDRGLNRHNHIEVADIPSRLQFGGGPGAAFDVESLRSALHAIEQSVDDLATRWDRAAESLADTSLFPTDGCRTS